MNSITIRSNKISLQISVFIFQEGEYQIAYSPALDLSGYGMDEDSALDDFKVVLKEYLSDQVTNNSLASDLEAHGWKKVDAYKALEPPFSVVYNTNKQLQKIAELPHRSSIVKMRQSCFA